MTVPEYLRWLADVIEKDSDDVAICLPRSTLSDTDHSISLRDISERWEKMAAAMDRLDCVFILHIDSEEFRVLYEALDAANKPLSETYDPEMTT